MKKLSIIFGILVAILAISCTPYSCPTYSYDKKATKSFNPVKPATIARR